MIIPEVVNYQLTKKNLIFEFEKLLNNENYRMSQINNINIYMSKLEPNQSPYEISANRILSLI